MDYGAFLLGLGVDLVAISLLAYGLYFRRHRRRDLTLGFIGVNVGLFAVASFVAHDVLTVGFGIGLFALLSVIRLRSTQVTQEEVGYYFVALVLGLVNGVVPETSWPHALILNVVLVGVLFAADHPRMLPHAGRNVVVLGKVHRSQAALQRDLEQRLGYEVSRFQIVDVDFDRRRTRVDVRFRTDRPVAPKPKRHDAAPALDGEVPPADVTSGTRTPPATDDEPHTSSAGPSASDARPRPTPPSTSIPTPTLPPDTAGPVADAGDVG